MRDLSSGTITPLTSPPAHDSVAFGFLDQPASTLIPGPSAPVVQSAMIT